jgi:hypothetical protein
LFFGGAGVFDEINEEVVVEGMGYLLKAGDGEVG